jgi:transcriptional regulator with XRE-family HTH domain
MKLAEWRRSREMTQQELADTLGCFVTSVARYEAGRRRPDDQTMMAIYVLSNGLVQPNDFYDLPVLADAQLEDAA